MFLTAKNPALFLDKKDIRKYFFILEIKYRTPIFGS
jgi:hypothetical protein